MLSMLPGAVGATWEHGKSWRSGSSRLRGPVELHLSTANPGTAAHQCYLGVGSLIVEGEWGLLCVEGYLRRLGTTCFALQALKAGTEAAESSVLSRVSHSMLAL